jgi:transposase
MRLRTTRTAVDGEHALIVAQKVTAEATDNRSLLPMAEAAQAAVCKPLSMNVVADAGYSNGEQAAACESKGILPHVPANRAINNHGDGTLFDRTAFHYDAATDTFHCPAGQTLTRKQLQRNKNRVVYTERSATCGARPMKDRCTSSPQRNVHATCMRARWIACGNVQRPPRCDCDDPPSSIPSAH